MTSLLSSNLTPADPEFTFLLANPSSEIHRQFVEQLWQQYEPYADRNFREEITRSFHCRFWEMYLAYSLLKIGFSLQPKAIDKGPDLRIKFGESSVWIEAVAPRQGTGPDAIPQPEMEKGKALFCFVPEEKIILRYRSAINDKYVKYQDYLKDGIIGETDPYVIALNGRKVPWSTPDDEIPYVVKATFGMGDETVTMAIDTGKVINHGYRSRPEILKATKAPVSSRIFLEEKYSCISGILFSNVDLWNRPAEPGADFTFVHNPMADNPLTRHWLQRGREYWVEDGKLAMTKLSS